MSTSAIVIEGLSKTYRRGRLRKGDLRNSLSSLWSSSGKENEEFDAVKDINLTIQQGDVVGMVGPNGAGKSTLLKLLSRITFPTTGRIKINGTLSSMLEVGTGFHPELTGRENIYLNGAIIGMRREEVSRKLDSIVSFSGLEDFLDTPVKHYSSGMYVRLAFSVASHLEPDILLIDEVLAVGDQEFRRKCLARLLDVSGEGRTILMVSHQMTYLKQLCTHGIYLAGGGIKKLGPIDEVIQEYINDFDQKNQTAIADRMDRKGSGTVKLISLSILDTYEQKVPVVAAGQALNFRLVLLSSQPESRDVEVKLEFYDPFGHLWCLCKNSISGSSIPVIKGKVTIDCVFPKFPLNKGTYHITATITVRNQLADEIINTATIEVEDGMFYETGKLPPAHKGFLADYQWKIHTD
jgi:lipopolysaccharide transport system ATP-binding protein